MAIMSSELAKILLEGIEQHGDRPVKIYLSQSEVVDDIEEIEHPDFPEIVYLDINY